MGRGGAGETVGRDRHAHCIHVSKETLTALVNIATLAIVVGSIVAVRTQSLRLALAIGATVYVSASLGFLYSVWRLYRPRSHRHA
jgi:exosortase/archaeosortase